MSRKILIIEDDRDIVHLLKVHLTEAGYETTEACDGNTGLEQATSGSYDLIILDLMLPGIDGLDICKRLREQSSYIPVLMLTSKSTELDRVLGLEIGADDYLTKPFSIRELMARVKALFRRMEGLRSKSDSDEQETIRAGDLVIDTEKRSVTLKGKPEHVTAKEFELLLTFAKNPGRVYTRSQLLSLVWGYKYEGYEHTVNSHINRLRTKIEKDPNNPRYILTVWGVGYKFSDDCEKLE
jgi:DNA-binding response OmpR family regulator